ncbi:glycosyltransferase family 4 protein [Candidatus Peregrinibacteria bacterium CG_4_9_14_0_2_um_filter_53_11]|nr:MAG: glycosyltransferase family 4 protein [Candidatus Peregrinibacteria bacterium CG_4_9_14_0_2_um_filter_53_11]
MGSQPRIALVHDFLLRYGGGERVLKVLADQYPEAPIYTLLYDQEKMGGYFPKERIRTSSLQRLPGFIRKRHRLLLPLMPRAIEELNLSGFETVISSNTAFAHGIITQPQTRHISYIHSPVRYAWDWTHAYIAENTGGPLSNLAVTSLMKRIRMWDRAAADRVDVFIANSHHVSKRITKYYRADSEVIYPPVDLSRFKISKKHDDFFLIVSTLTPYKRVELAVELFNKIGKPLIIIGDGPQREFLESIAGENISFMGRQSDEVVNDYMHRAKALLFPGEEDFGITPIEAMACGKPVVAYGEGGVTETVIPGVTGEFFPEPSAGSMEDALGELIKNYDRYDPAACRRQAEKFETEIFLKKMRTLVENRG